MRIDRLTMDAFGAFKDLSVEFVPGFNLFFGENEHGKSTLIDGLLLGLLGAPANSELRRRYAPLANREYRVTVFFTTADGRRLRIERDLTPGGRDAVGVLEGENWVVKRRSATILKELGLPSLELARATAVVTGSEVVLAAKDGETVSKAISARATGDANALSGQQAIKRLQERRVHLENKERRALEDERRRLRAEEAEMAAAAAVGRDLEAARQAAEERLQAAKESIARYRPAVEAFQALCQAREACARAERAHAEVFRDLQSIREKEEILARLEKEMSALAPRPEALSTDALARYQRLEARREEAAAAGREIARIRGELDLIRAKMDFYRRKGFTPERLRELDRIDGAVGLARKNLQEKEAALAKAERPGARGILWPALVLAAAGGIGLGLGGIRPGWILAGLALAVGLLVMARRSVDAGRRRLLAEAVAKAAKEVELAQAAFMARSGGMDLAAWQAEYAAAQTLAEECRELEAQLQAQSAVGLSAADEEELAAILAAAGARDGDEFLAKAAAYREYSQKMAETRAALDSLLRGEDRAAWEEKGLALARAEAAASAELKAAAEAAAGLEPEVIAKYRQELASLDVAALENEATAARSACEQHQKSMARRDPWEIETGLTLIESALVENRKRAEAVRLAIEVLGEAVAEVQGNLVPRIERAAGEHFTRLTGGRYEGLAVTSGANLLDVAPRRGGEILPGRILSSGTADQMYLALRLALAEALQGPDPLPLILDDPFLTFDRPRLGHALELLCGLEQQVILVTKDEILRDLARQSGIEAKSLPGVAGA